jgi:ubiquinone/menaquinone biosynthesis C-methylase UbiE
MVGTSPKTVPGNPFTDPELVKGYEGWYRSAGRRVDRLEKRLPKVLLDRFPRADEILQVGCGTGHFARWMSWRDFRAVGLDSSAAMLAEAKRLEGGLYIAGDALDLPFGSNSLDLVILITTLEFIQDPIRALIEAHRVARKGLILGVINRRSRLGRQLRSKGGAI